MEIKLNDFIKIDYDLYANEKLVQTTNEKLGKGANLKVKNYGNVTLIVGKNYILKAMDNDIVLGKTENTLSLEAKDAYGNRDKKLIRTMAKSSFDEHKMKAVVGMTYDFNGMYGTVKAVTGARIMVDFNNPLAGKKIKLSYKIVEKIEKMEDKLSFILIFIVKLPKAVFDIKIENKKINIAIPKEVLTLKGKLTKTFIELLPQIKEFELGYTLKSITIPKKSN